MTKFIHTSDWQLGMTRAFLTAESLPRFSQARIDAVVRLGELAREHAAQFIVVAGDVFESNQVSSETLKRTLDALKSLPVPVFLLPGNHDPLDGASIFATPEFASAPEHVVVLRDEGPVAVPGLAGVEVVGAPWRSKRPSTDLCAAMAAQLAPAAGLIRVAVAHGQVDTLSPDPDAPGLVDLGAAERALAESKFHYLALGDRHSVTDVGSTGRIWYSGAPVATAFDETEPNQALLVTLDDECRVERLPVGDWHFVAEQRDMNGDEDLRRFDAWLEALPNKACTAVKLGLEGSINLATAAELERLFDERAELFASLRRRERTSNLAVVPDDLDRDSVSLDGYAKDAWNELLAQAGADDAAARDALMLLYRLGVREDA